jgi:hypothetical protein
MYFVYASKGERFKRYREYYFASEDVDAALDDAITRIDETGEEHYVKELRSYPHRLIFTVESGQVFRPYVHNAGEADL